MIDGRRGALLFAILIALSTAARSSAAEPDPAGRFKRIAQREHVQSSLAWRRLLHFRSNLLGAPSSEIDGNAFFLAPNGRHDANAELTATLAAFFAPVVEGRHDQHALCRYPARFAYLDRKLGLSRALKRPSCPKLERFLQRVNATRVAVVYAANSLENPASAFGHTFLYLENDTSRHASVSVDFRADTDTNFPPLYAFKGLTGLFDGYFYAEPASVRIHDYSIVNNRDLWFFELTLESHEVELLRLHLWELSATRIDYFYLTENCSYQILGALEAAAPRLRLTERIKVTVLPMDTVKALFASPDLVSSVGYVPSRSSREMLPENRHGEPPRIPWEKSPERGHGSWRVDLGTGATTIGDTGFAMLGFRLAHHDLVDPTQGHPRLAQIQFLNTRLRYAYEPRRLTLDTLTFAELISLHPLNRADYMASWRAGAYGERIYDDRCANRDCFGHGVSISLGATLTAFGDALAVYLMGDGFVRFSGRFDGIGGSFVSAGVGPYGGMRLRFSHASALLVSGTYSFLPGQNLERTYDVRGTLRTALGGNVAVGIDSRWAPAGLQAELTSYFYF